MSIQAARHRRNREPLATARRLRRTRSRGVVSLWVIISLPAALLFLCFLIEIGNLWLARVELENALEAAVLAAVDEWGDAGGGSTQTARNVAIAYADANTVTGDPVVLTDNYNVANVPNENADCDGDLIFGAVTSASSPWAFNAGIAPNCGGGPVYGVRAQATVTVNSVCSSLFGVSLGTFNVSATTTARYDCATGRPVLIRVRSADVTCPGP